MNPEGFVDTDPNDGLPDEQGDPDDDDETTKLKVAMGTCPPISDIFRSRTESLE